jgi:Arc/MetJ-type ribon-helix-helix transcriptional regulator
MSNGSAPTAVLAALERAQDAFEMVGHGQTAFEEGISADEDWKTQSEFIRYALRDAVNPPKQLSEEALELLVESRLQREQGETVSQDDVKDRLGIDD